MSLNFPAYQAEVLSQVHTCKFTPNIRQTNTHESEHNVLRQKDDKNTSTGIFKDAQDSPGIPSHVRSINIVDELYNALNERRLEACMSIYHEDCRIYEN